MIHLTRDILQSLYETLRLTPPFNRWKLPPGCKVKFHVATTRDFQADYWFDAAKKQHNIRVSAARHHTLPSAMATIGHEMVHMRERALGCTRGDIQHGAVFQRLADQVCRRHGFDRGQF